MKLLSLLHEKAGFTQNEVKVVLFLSITFLIGLGIQRYRSSPAAAPASTPYDYTLLDSEFVARSQALDSLPAQTASRAAFLPREPKKPPAAESIDLNSATEKELIRLPGIGEEYARRIVRYRTEQGRFGSVDDLRKVKGIGPKKLERVRPFVTVH